MLWRPEGESTKKKGDGSMQGVLKAWAAIIRCIFDYGYCDLCKETASLRVIERREKKKTTSSQGEEEKREEKTPTFILRHSKVCTPCWFYLIKESMERSAKK